MNIALEELVITWRFKLMKGGREGSREGREGERKGREGGGEGREEGKEGSSSKKYPHVKSVLICLENLCKISDVKLTTISGHLTFA